MKFFLRWSSSPYELDICTTLTKFYEVRRFLLDDGYRATRGSPTKAYALVEDTIERAERRDNSWFLTGDRSWDPESHLSYKFPFVKHAAGTLKRVNVHLIRCEPYRHVLASAVSECLSAHRDEASLMSLASASYVLYDVRQGGCTVRTQYLQRPCRFYPPQSEISHPNPTGRLFHRFGGWLRVEVPNSIWSPISIREAPCRRVWP